MTFKGIVFNTNPFDVDQLSLKDAKNVYVDENGTLISRPPITVKKATSSLYETDGTTKRAAYPFTTKASCAFETVVSDSKSGNDIILL